MQLTLTEQQLGNAVLGFWFVTSQLLMFLPSISERFKERFAGFGYCWFVMSYAFFLPSITVVTLGLTGYLPLSATKTALTISI